MLDAVDDFVIVITEDNIAMFSHDFNNQFFVADITQFVQMLQLQMQDTLQAGLGNVDNSCILQVLSQQHTKTRSSQRTLLVILGQIHQGERGIGRKEKPVLGAIVLYRQKSLVIFRLGNLIDTASQQSVI